MKKLPLTAKCAIFSSEFSNVNAELPSTDGLKLK
ncbi:hypothetical protein T12_7994 [Trichinella patagoniensis]|uniref:Uncharacterized protein n=1 Tax=Trichinella patagoniensis TaxID=990121 RepID=A0A0V0WJH1_9BILA|nr:hypothetical protein T12_7994 [Trichinella patagoniensis]